MIPMRMRTLLWCIVLLIPRGVAAGEAVFAGIDPLQWAAEPHARLSHTVTMAAEAVASPGGVEYNFACTAGGAKNSGWQASPEYKVTGLKPETPYTFVARVRDKASGKELRAPSLPIAVTTRKAGPFDEIVSKEIELVPIMANGDKDNRINIVVVNRWREGERNAYNKPEMRETFLKDVRDVIEPAIAPGGPKAMQPFATQRSFYNAYALWWPGIPPWDPKAYDKGEKAAHWNTYNELRARLFLPWHIEGKGWVTHLAMVNSRGGGGGAGLRIEERVGDAMIEGNDIPPFYHEFSHTAMMLGDKYIGWGMWGRADESSNTTLVFQREKIKWRAWIDPDTPVPTPYCAKFLHRIGLFEGGTHRAAGIFRATPVCTMGVSQFAEHMCVLCVQTAAQRTYQWVDPIEDPRPVRTELTLERPGRARFSIRRVKPTPDTQKVEWRLNGKLIAEGTDAVDVALGSFAEEELICTIVDQTPLVRPDPPFADWPRAERRWRIRNPQSNANAPSEKQTPPPPRPGPEAKPRPVKPPGTLRVTVAEAIPSTGENNGEIRLAIAGGTKPCTIAWADDPKETTAERLFLPPGSYRAVVRDANDATLEKVVTIGDEAPFELARPSFQRAPSGTVRIANPQKGFRYLWFAEDYPSYVPRPPRGVYEGTFTAKDGRAVEADGAVIANTNGKWANPPSVSKDQNRTKNDYGSWVRLDAYLAGRRALPLTLRLQTDHRGQLWQKLAVSGETQRSQKPTEIIGEGKWKGTVDDGRLIVEGEGPDGGRFDLRYTARREHMSRPIAVGAEFRPPRPGNYFVAAQKEDTGAISFNRVGVAVTMGEGRADAKPVRPDEVKSCKPVLWLDATDVDGDGVEDNPPWERGSLLGWRGKPGGFGTTSFVIYEPNIQNGRPIANWQYIWLESLEKAVGGFQTVVMVYRDHELSKPATGPWGGVPAWIWDLRKADAEVRKGRADAFRGARVWLNGKPADPCATPAPMEFCIATFEYPSTRGGLSRTETLWEGAVAEFLAFDGKLTDAERQGVEEYLWRKWISAVHLEGPVELQAN